MQTNHLRRDHRPIFLWLMACALLVACMVMLGGYTRLSGSGLSITSWKPLHGTLPPLNYAQWEEEFTAYRQSPQFQLVNSEMSLAEFKGIFWPEFLHRLLGRLVGIAFFIPFAIFLKRGSITSRFGWRLCGIFVLGGLQGLVGWLMVASGLVNEPRVSHLRLAAHLSLAFTIFALLLTAAMDVRNDGIPNIVHFPPKLLKTYKIWFSALCLQIVYGAFMAGLHAGLVYNTWPDMNGRFIPEDISYLSPWVLNYLNNIATVQFVHRTLAIGLALAYGLWWLFAHKHANKSVVNRLMSSVGLILLLQFALGVITLLHMAPLPLAWLHQCIGLVLFASAVLLLHQLRAAKYTERHINA